LGITDPVTTERFVVLNGDAVVVTVMELAVFTGEDARAGVIPGALAVQLLLAHVVCKPRLRYACAVITGALCSRGTTIALVIVVLGATQLNVIALAIAEEIAWDAPLTVTGHDLAFSA